MTPAVELRSLYKQFGSVVANADISLTLEKGSIHAVVGENGAGKSTAMKMLYGIYPPDSGEIWVKGQRQSWRSSSDAIASGIGMVHQHFMLADPFDCVENIVLGAEFGIRRPLGSWNWLNGLKTFFGKIERKTVQSRLERLSDQYGLKIPFEKKVGTLSIGVRQRIEILKLLYREAQILILDEPTAVLTPQETAELFVNLRKLREEGKSILLITHKLKEVMEISDQISVFRAGRVVAHRKTSETQLEELAHLIVGRKVELRIEPQKKEGGRVMSPPLLEVSGLSLQFSDKGQVLDLSQNLQQVEFQVSPGEVVGIAGVEGNGQSELLQVLLRPRDFSRQISGTVRYFGTEWKRNGRYLSTLEIKNLGIGIIPEDRHSQGLLLNRPISESFLLGLHRKEPFCLAGLIQQGGLNQALLRAADEYDIRPKGRDLLCLSAGVLSGGNQQKVIIAREFENRPRLLIASQPTRGVDIGAIEFIHRKIMKACETGMGVLLVSSELDEVLALSDRILVMYRGRFVASFSRGEADERTLGLAMGGALDESGR